MNRRVFLLGPLPPFRSGIADQTYRLARELSRMGADVRIATFERLYPAVLYPGESPAAEGDWPADCGRIDACLDGLNPLTFVAAAGDAARWDPAFLVVPWWTAFFALHTLLFFNGLPASLGQRTILYCHNLYDHESAAWKRWLSSLPLERYRRFVVQNRRLEKELIGLRPDADVLYLPHPVEPPRFSFEKSEARRRLGVLPEAQLLLFSGLLRSYKGWDLLLSAFLRISPRHPRAILVFAGEPWGDARRLETARADPQVRLELRYLTEEERGLWFSAADAVVCPYRAATGSGIAADAIAFGRAILGSRVDGLTEVVREGESGLLADPGDETGLAGILDRFLSESLTETLSAGALRQRGEFSPAGHAQSVIRFGGLSL